MNLDSSTCDKLLERLIQRIPEAPGCPDGCCRCCGPVAMSKAEARKIGLDRMYTLGKGEHGDTCEFVDDETGKCSIYENRPFVCHFFNSAYAGVFKCYEIPESGGLKPSESWEVLSAYFELLELEGHTAEYALAMDKTYDLMGQRERRNGWGPKNFGLNVPK